MLYREFQVEIIWEIQYAPGACKTHYKKKSLGLGVPILHTCRPLGVVFWRAWRIFGMPFTWNAPWPIFTVAFPKWRPTIKYILYIYILYIYIYFYQQLSSLFSDAKLYYSTLQYLNTLSLWHSWKTHLFSPTAMHSSELKLRVEQESWKKLTKPFAIFSYECSLFALQADC